MFASQLLRILQTIPDDTKYETCVVDQNDQSNIMRESQNAAFYYSESFSKKAESLAFGSKEIIKSNSSRTNNVVAFDLSHGNEHWNSNFLRSSKKNDSRTIDSSGKENQNKQLYHINCENGDSDSSSSSEIKGEDKSRRSPEFESSVMIAESTQSNENETQTSHLPRISASDFIEPDSNLYSDKNEFNFDLPELMVCYKESNNQTVKDDFIDESFSVEENKLIENSSHDQASDDSHCEATEEVLNLESFVSGVLTATCLDNTEVVCVDECWSKEEIDGELLSQGRSKSPSESSSAEDTTKESDQDNSIQTDESKVSITGTIASDDSEEDSFVVNALPVQPFGTRSFLRSFLNSLDIEEINVVQSCNENSFGKVMSEHSTETSAEAQKKEDVQARKTCYSSTLERKTITFNFNSYVPALASKTKKINENLNQQYVESGYEQERKIENAYNLSETRQVQCPLMNKDTFENVDGQSVNITNGNPMKFSVTSPLKTISNGNRCKENHPEQSPDDSSFTYLSTDDQTQFAKRKSRGSADNNDRPVETHLLKHDQVNSGGSSVVTAIRDEEGETSFSATHLISYSGAIPYSGSLSMRSDGSATSSRSFAFPILQAEWKSPMRMEEAGTGRFQKHKDWRSGLFCCRC